MAEKLIETNYNAETGETTEIELKGEALTEFIAFRDASNAAISAAEEARVAKEDAKKAALTRVGLTEEEASLILGIASTGGND
jgi:hypothetical protein